MWTSRLLGRVRLFPLTLVAASALLAIKLFGIGAALNGSDARGIAGYAAIQPAYASGGVAESKSAHGAPAKSDSGAAHSQPAKGEGTATSLAAEHTGATAACPPPPAAPVLPSAGEMEMLQQLGKRRESLDAREGELDRREDLLRAADTRIAEKVEQMQALEVSLNQLMKKYDEQEETKIKSLVKIYESMKQKDAAQIFEQLDMDILLAVAERMNERKLAPVMAEMNPAKARQMTEQLANLRRLATAGRPPG